MTTRWKMLISYNLYHATKNTANQNAGKSLCIRRYSTEPLCTAMIVQGYVFSVTWYKILMQSVLVIYHGISHLPRVLSLPIHILLKTCGISHVIIHQRFSFAIGLNASRDWIFPSNIRWYSPNSRCEKYLKDNKHNRSLSLTWPAAILVQWNKRKYLHKNRVQFPEG